MDNRNVTAMILILGILVVFSYFNTPVEIERTEDSVETTITEEVLTTKSLSEEANSFPSDDTTTDSLAYARLRATFGDLAPMAMGEEKEFNLTNGKINVNFSSKGGQIKGVLLKDYQGVKRGDQGEDIFFPVVLNKHDENKFTFELPTIWGEIRTEDLYFETEQDGNSLLFTADNKKGQKIIKQYSLKEDSYEISYSIDLQGFERSMQIEKPLRLYFKNNLNPYEKNIDYERTYSTIYYKIDEGGTDYCSCRNSDTEDLTGKSIKWISSSNQFFNFTLIGNAPFEGGTVETLVPEDPQTVDYLKSTVAHLNLSKYSSNSSQYNFTIFAGPNEFELLKSYNLYLEDIIPFGSSIFGSINRWIIRPLFNFMELFFNNPGISIVFLTLLVKLFMYPLTYKMLYSQAKMSALKPRLSHLKDKYKDDAAGLQAETMKIYREHGASPLDGCFPMFLQMPIWFALYRFFPASIDFRQAEFLWATDLSTYDEFITLPFELPFYGAHVSLFTILWAGTTILYTWYNSQQMSQMTNMNPMMKYMQYFMPIMFIFAFNNFASGLTAYLFFSNVFNIGQTFVTRKFIIDEQKIIAKMEDYKKKPKKKSSFQDKLEKALAEQQRIAKEKEKQPKKNK
jgi:YidC/Oxa1 family membrane protein insertase